jgi:pyrroline-5-carboxylate reductase
VNITFIGGGVMGEAMLSALLKKGVAKPEAIVVSDINHARLNVLQEKYHIRCISDNREAALGHSCDVTVLAVKPQSLNEVMAELKGELWGKTLVLSIVAGATIKILSQGLRHNSIVRAMPNTPAQIGEGISIWTATEAVSQAQKEMAQAILAALGREIYVNDERYIDMATAVSGSGPAYIFLVIEALSDAAVHIGLPRELAEEMVVETVLGSARLAQATGRHPAELRNMVTSPGGTTAEGLLRLEEGGIRAILAQAVIAAYEKAQALAEKQR